MGENIGKQNTKKKNVLEDELKKNMIAKKMMSEE